VGRGAGGAAAGPRPAADGPETAADGGGRSALNHVGLTADDPASESARLESLAFELIVHSRLGEVEFFCIEIVTARPEVDAFWHDASDALGYWGTVAAGARGWDGRDPVRSF
jgi:hypothetical protein